MGRSRRWFSASKHFARQFAGSFSRNQSLDLAAQLAYYAILSLFPFAMFLLTVVGYIPLHGLAEQITGMIYQFMPTATAKLLDHTIHEIVGRQRGWLLWSTLAFALWSASGGTDGLITALNRAYGVVETRAWWKVKLRALIVTIAGVVAIIVATVAMLVGPNIVHTIWAFFGLGTWFDLLWAIIRVPLAVVVLMLMLACIYYFLPNVKQKWRFITPGSVTAVLAWILASWGFRAYVGHFDSYAKTYGALGTVIVLLVWLYLSGLMVILGGEINAILDRVVKQMRHTEEERGPVTIPDRAPADGHDRPLPPAGQPA
jgi:membrane protein